MAIRVLGFDLDQTLYPKSPEIDEAIQAYIYVKIAEHRGCSIEEGKKLFRSYYPKLSGSKSLMALGVPNAHNIVQEALERADIDKFLTPNQDVHKLLYDLKKHFGSLSLLTGSNKPIAMKKLLKLEIDLSLFDFVITGETPKSDGTAFRQWLEHFQQHDSTLKPEEFLYVGDRVSTDVDMPATLGIKSVLVNVTKKKEEVTVAQFTSLLELREYLLK